VFVPQLGGLRQETDISETGFSGTGMKLIWDIRYYENVGRTIIGKVRQDNLGSLYQIPYRTFLNLGERFSCKLR